MAYDYFLRGSARNEDGQPPVPFPRQYQNNAAKALEEISAICIGILCDQEVNDKEANFLREWLEKHDQFLGISWFKDLHTRVSRIFQDGRIDADERQELRSVMEHIRGGSDLHTTYSTPLPLDTPPPTPIEFLNRYFCITGKFAFGKRSNVIDAITAKGGKASDNQPAQYTSYLVIGQFCSRDWLEQSYGTKIMKATELREQGHPIRIISENHWRTFIRS